MFPVAKVKGRLATTSTQQAAKSSSTDGNSSESDQDLSGVNSSTHISDESGTRVNVSQEDQGFENESEGESEREDLKVKELQQHEPREVDEASVAADPMVSSKAPNRATGQSIRNSIDVSSPNRPEVVDPVVRRTKDPSSEVVEVRQQSKNGRETGTQRAKEVEEDEGEQEEENPYFVRFHNLFWKYCMLTILIVRCSR